MFRCNINVPTSISFVVNQTFDVLCFQGLVRLDFTFFTLSSEHAKKEYPRCSETQ